MVLIIVYILNQLIDVPKNLQNNKVFKRVNALKIRSIAFAMIAAWVIMVMLSFIFTMIFREAISPEGYHFQYFVWGDNWYRPSPATGIVMLLIAEVFRIGTEIAEEQDLTI